jgi:DNA-directed RNA polymerase III subunit RPC11
MSRPVCPVCSNRLQIGKVTAGTEAEVDRNRFECKTCPYQHIMGKDEKWYERKNFKRKDVEDVIGGREAWTNADQMDGMSPPSLRCLD